MPTEPDWSKGVFDDLEWEPGEAGAQKKLRRFLETGLSKYGKRRDFPAENSPATSLLSPHLHFGEITPHQAWYAVLASGCEKKQIG